MAEELDFLHRLSRGIDQRECRPSASTASRRTARARHMISHTMEMMLVRAERDLGRLSSTVTPRLRVAFLESGRRLDRAVARPAWTGTSMTRASNEVRAEDEAERAVPAQLLDPRSKPVESSIAVLADYNRASQDHVGPPITRTRTASSPGRAADAPRAARIAVPRGEAPGARRGAPLASTASGLTRRRQAGTTKSGAKRS